MDQLSLSHQSILLQSLVQSKLLRSLALEPIPAKGNDMISTSWDPFDVAQLGLEKHGGGRSLDVPCLLSFRRSDLFFFGEFRGMNF